MEAKIEQIKSNPKYKKDQRKLQAIDTLYKFNQIMEVSLEQIEDKFEVMKSEMDKSQPDFTSGKRRINIKKETLKNKKSLQNSQIRQLMTYFAKLKKEEKSLKIK